LCGNFGLIFAYQAKTKFVENKINEAETNKKRLKELADQLNQQCRVDQSVINVLNDAAKNRKEKAR
jgi:hypothetical protein